MASILEQYESMYQSGQISDNVANGTQLYASSTLRNTIPSKNEGIINLRSDQMEPIFTKSKIDFRPNYPITHMVVSNNQLLLSMENLRLLKIDLTDISKPTEIDLNHYLTTIKTQKPIISGLFMDPSGAHCLISIGQKNPLIPTSTPSDMNNTPDMMTNLAPYENFYYHRKLSILTKMKDHIVTAVGWLDQLNNLNGPGCGNLLVGTNEGRVFETHFQPDDRFLASRELSFWKPVCDLSTTTNLSTINLDQSISLSSSLDPNKTTSTTKKEPICAIKCFRLKNSNSGFCILIATRNFFYQYLGQVTNPSQSDGLPYLYQVIQNPRQKAYKEMPGYIPTTKLDLFQPTGVHYPKSFGWLTKPGIFYGEIPNDLGPDQDKRIFDEASVIMYNDLIQSSRKSSTNFDNLIDTNQAIPISLILTNFHLLLLYPTKLQIFCVLNQELVMEDRFLSEPSESLVKDPIRNTIWSYTKHAVYLYKIHQEDRNIWEIYLKKKDFKLARKYAQNDFLKMDKTICEEALHYFVKKDYKRSAQLFTQTRSKSFEEIALKFIELRDRNQEALKVFLLNKLQTLSPEKEHIQITILLLWIFELMLNQLAALQSSIQDPLSTKDSSSGSQSEVSKNFKAEYQRIELTLKNLILNVNYKTAFKKNKKIFYNLILNHHNSDIYEYFATEIDDFECLLEHYCRRKEFNRALTLLKREECLDLYYQYSPLLIRHLPRELVDCLIPLASELDFAKLIPSLVHFDHSNNKQQNENHYRNNHDVNYDELRELQCKEILRFLEFCVYNLQTRNSLVHNYFLAMLVQYEPAKLMTYLNDVSNIEEVPYDLRYAARICMQNKMVPSKALVQILATMGAYEEAVEQALFVNDVDLAKQTADQVQTMLNNRQFGHNHHHNHDLAKRLWLKIAKHVIRNIYSGDDNTNGKRPEQETNGKNFDISMATSILNECSLLKIEDILPYFPEYLTIDHFKSAICQSLEEYNNHIESLREDMKLATESAQQIREEINKIRNRFTIIGSTDPCNLCLFPAIQEHFYSFPSCGHLFHYKCLVTEIVEYLPEDDRITLETMLFESKSIQNQLQNLIMTGDSNIKNNSNSFSSLDQSGTEPSSISLTNRLENINSKIEDLIGSECLFCGNLMIQTIDKPFIDPIRDREEMHGWN